MGLVEGVESRTYHVEGYGDEDAHQTVHQDATSCRLLVGSGHVTLDDGLVGGIGDEVVGQPSDDAHPPHGLAPCHVPIEEPQLVVLQGKVKAAAQSAFGVRHQVDDGKDGTSHQDESLHHVTPDDGFHTSHRAVDDGDQPHQDDAQADVDARHSREGKRGEIEHQGHAGYHEETEEGGCHEACGGIEALFQNLVGTRHVHAPEVRQVVFYHRETDHKHHPQYGVIGPVGGVCLGGNGHVGDGRDHGGIDADAGGPPGYASASLEEVAGSLLLAHEVHAHEEHGYEVEAEDGPVHPTETLPVCNFHMGDIGGAYPGHRLATTVQPASCPPVGGEAGTGTGQSLVTGQQGPGVGDGVVGQDFLPEPVPPGFMAQVHAVLTALYGTEEDVVIHASEEEDVTVAHRCTGAAHHGLQAAPRLPFTQGQGWGGTVPVGGTPASLTEFCQGHIHTIGIDPCMESEGIDPGLITSEDEERIPLCRVLHTQAGLQAARIGQLSHRAPLPFPVGPGEGIDLPVGDAVRLSACHPQGSFMPGSGKAVESLGQGGHVLTSSLLGAVEKTAAEGGEAVRTSQHEDTFPHIYAGPVCHGIEDLAAPVGTGHIGEIASSPCPESIPYPPCIVPRDRFLERRGRVRTYRILSHAQHRTEEA